MQTRTSYIYNITARVIIVGLQSHVLIISAVLGKINYQKKKIIPPVRKRGVGEAREQLGVYLYTYMPV